MDALSLASNHLGTNVQVKSNDYIKLGFIYFICFAMVHMELPVPVRFLIAIAILIYQLTSFFNATAILIFVLFIPFVSSMLGSETSGLKFQRLACWPFFYYLITSKSIRSLPINPFILLMILVSLMSIKLSADILNTVQVPKVTMGMKEPVSVKNLLAKIFDSSLYFFLFYAVFTKFSQRNINILFNFIVVLGCLQAITLVFLVIQNPQAVLGMGSGEFDRYYLWRNPYFGHKNDWGILLVFVVFLALNRLNADPKQRYFYLFTIGCCLMAVAFSLSRQAYLFTVLGFIIFTVMNKDVKLGMGFVAIVAIILITQPAFLFDRLDTMINMESAEDFQNLSRKVSDLALDQFVSNLVIIPRMFFVEWEYNWSEGFWNGLAHQQGVLGLIYHVFLYIVLFARYFYFYRQKQRNLSILGITGIIFCTFMFIGCVNRRAINFMHYDGTIRQMGFVALFLLGYSEYVYWSLKRRLVGSNLL